MITWDTRGTRVTYVNTLKQMNHIMRLEQRLRYEIGAHRGGKQ